MFWIIFRIAGVLGLGATVERWFSPGQNSDTPRTGVMAFLPLLIVAAVVYFIYRVMGKRIVIK